MQSPCARVVLIHLAVSLNFPCIDSDIVQEGTSGKTFAGCLRVLDVTKPTVAIFENIELIGDVSSLQQEPEDALGATPRRQHLSSTARPNLHCSIACAVCTLWVPPPCLS